MAVKILSTKEKEWAYRKWCEGYTHLEIAEALNVCGKTITRTLHGKQKVKKVLRYPE